MDIVRRGAGEDKHILVVDDEARTSARWSSTPSRREGFRVTCTDGGKAALDAARAGGVDLVVLDVMLPDVDGLARSAAPPRRRKPRPGAVPLGARRGGRSRRRPRTRRRRLPDEALFAARARRPGPRRPPARRGLAGERDAAARRSTELEDRDRVGSRFGLGPNRCDRAPPRDLGRRRAPRGPLRRPGDRPHPHRVRPARRAPRATRRRLLARSADAARLCLRQPRDRADDRHPRSPDPRQVPRRRLRPDRDGPRRRLQGSRKAEARCAPRPSRGSSAGCGCGSSSSTWCSCSCRSPASSSRASTSGSSSRRSSATCAIKRRSFARASKPISSAASPSTTAPTAKC